MLCLSYFILDKAKSTRDYEKKSLIDSKHSNHTDAEERALVQFKELMKVGLVQVLVKWETQNPVANSVILIHLIFRVEINSPP